MVLDYSNQKERSSQQEVEEEEKRQWGAHRWNMFFLIGDKQCITRANSGLV